MSLDKQQDFLALLSASLDQGEFLKLSLTGHLDRSQQLNSLLVRRVQIKGQDQLALTYRYATRDVVKNWPIEAALTKIAGLLGQSFKHGRLFSSVQDVELSYNKRGEPRLTRLKPALGQNVQTEGHDRSKNRLIDPTSPYLQPLGIASQQGEILKGKESKFKQMNKFLEILDGLYRSSNLKDQASLTLLDMGSGKGYLTFAAYDFFNNQLNKSTSVTGIEYRQELVDFCNQVAGMAGFDRLQFEQGSIQDCDDRQADITIALHACDTATDDAIYKGIQFGASLIILSPCCHKQVRREMAKNALVKSSLEFGILIERQAEIITDRLRALLLERCGYTTKVFEFITSEHTSKNLMITAVKHSKPVDQANVMEQIAALKTAYGVESHYLERLLALPLNSQLENV